MVKQLNNDQIRRRVESIRSNWDLETRVQRRETGRTRRAALIAALLRAEENPAKPADPEDARKQRA